MVSNYINSGYRITVSGVYLTENALENPNLVQVSVMADTFMYVRPLGEAYSAGIRYQENGEAPSWRLTGVNTRINNAGAHNIYARLRRDRDGESLITFDILNRNIDGTVKGDSDSAIDPDYYYIKIGMLSATDSVETPTIKREITFDFGYYKTDSSQDQDSGGWQELFELTGNGLINALKHFTSFVVEGTITLIGRLEFGKDTGKYVDNIHRSFDDKDAEFTDTSVSSSKYIDNTYLNKTKPDEAQEIITFSKGLVSKGKSVFTEDVEMEKNLHVENTVTAGTVKSDLLLSSLFSSGPLGSGYVVKIDPVTGHSYIEVDELFVRIKAMFTELEIRKLSYSGGNYIFSAAGIKCTDIEEHDNFWRCYFLADNGEVAIENLFREDDQVRFQEFNIKSGVYHNVSNRYYWRLCVGVGDNYIDLSKTDCDPISDAPQKGDSMVQLGNRTNVSRQNAITLSVYGDDAPSIHQYAGINSYSLQGKEVTVISPKGNKFIGDFFLTTGINVLTQFQITEDLLHSEIAKLQEEVNKKDNFLSNSSFTTSVDKWETTNQTRFYTFGGKFYFLNGAFYSEKKQIASIIRLGNQNVLRIKNTGIRQKNENLSKHPELRGIVSTFYVSMRIKVIEHGVLTVGFPGQELYKTETIEPTEGFVMKEYLGAWNGTGDFELKFTGNAYIYFLALTDNAFDDMYTHFSSEIEQSNKKISLLVKATSNEGGTIGSRIDTMANGIKLVTEKANSLGQTLTKMGIIIDGDNERITSFVQKNGVISSINQTSESIQIDARRINLVGAVTFSMLDSGLSTTINGKADSSSLGRLAKENEVSVAMLGETVIKGGYLNTEYINVNKIKATEGTIAGFSINREGLYTQGGSANSSLLSPDKIILKKEYYDPSLTTVYARNECRLGSGAADGGNSGDMVAYFRRDLTGTDFYKPAVKIESKVYSRDGVSLDLIGALTVKGGIIERGYSLELRSGGANVLDLTLGTTYNVFNNSADSNLYIPTHSQVCEQLRIGAYDTFCIRIVIMNNKTSSNSVFVTSQKHAGANVSDAGIFVEHNGGEWRNSIVELGRGDIIVFYLTYLYISGYYAQLENYYN